MCKRFLAANNILYQYHFGFWKYLFTSMAVIDVIDNIRRCLDNSANWDSCWYLCWFRLQNAFDTVSHNILLYKISNYIII